MARKSDPAFEIGFYESVLRGAPNDTMVVELLGGLYTQVGRLQDGLKMDRRMVRLVPTNATAHYNLACSLALCKRPADALRSLKKAIELGYDDADWMGEDPDLDGLRKNPVFKSLLASLKS